MSLPADDSTLELQLSSVLWLQSGMPARFAKQFVTCTDHILRSSRWFGQLTRHAGNRLLNLVGGALMLAVLATPPLVADGQQSLTDDIFLQQLTERSLFDSALHYCINLRDRATMADDKAWWQLRLADVAEQQAWMTAAESRHDLLNQAVTDLFDFAANQQISAEWELRLRLQQAAMIRTSTQIAIRINESGQLFGGLPSNEPVQPQPVSQQRAERVNDAIQLLVRSGEQLENIRPHIDSTVARNLREQSRTLQAELHALQSHLALNSDPDSAKQHRQQAEDLFRQVLRSTRDATVKYRCEWSLAELWLVHHNTEGAADSREFDARMRLLEALAAPRNASLPQILSAKRALLQRNPTQAMKSLSTATAASQYQQQELYWLRLECILGKFELADQLSDTELRDDATDEFRSTLAAAIAATSGVHAEASDRVAARFDLVEAVGAAIADQIQQIETLRSAGRTDEALQQIDATLRTLSTERPSQSRAALQMHAGELLIELQRWPEADLRLTDAAALFNAASRQPEAATADLLRIFTMAQQLARHPDRTAAYSSALQQHLSEYAAETTAQMARDWLFQVLKRQSPRDAFDLAVTMLEHSTQQSEKLMLLERMGGMLSELLTDASGNEADEMRVTQFRHAVAQLRRQSSFSEARFANVELGLLLLDAKPENSPDWTEIATRLKTIQDAMSFADASDRKHHTKMLLLQAVVAARLRTSAADMNTVREAVTQLPVATYDDCVTFLYSHYASRQLQAGNQWLAQLSDALLRQLILRPASVRQQMQWLKIAGRNSDLIGNTDVMNRITRQLSEQTLSTQEITDLAELMTGLNSNSSTAAQTTFWRNLLRVSQQGSNHWLEASLRLAEFAAAAGEKDAAKRQLGIIFAIYPDWGDADRLKRAQALIKSLP